MCVVADDHCPYQPLFLMEGVMAHTRDERGDTLGTDSVQESLKTLRIFEKVGC